MKNDNSNEEKEIISIGNIREDNNMLYNLEDNEENINLSDINDKTKSDIEPLYVMTLELAKGKNEQIKIYSNSNPAELAYNFCKANNLDLSALTYLKEEIDKLILKKQSSGHNNNQDDETQNAFEQSNALSRESNHSSSNLQTSKLLLNANIQKNLEGEGNDISSINKNNSQLSKEDNSLSESLVNNIISSSIIKANRDVNVVIKEKEDERVNDNMNEHNSSVQENKNSFSFTMTNQRKSASTFSRISHTRKDKDNEKDMDKGRKKIKGKENRDNNRRYNPIIKKHILTPNSNPFVSISQSSIKNDIQNKKSTIDQGKGNHKAKSKERVDRIKPYHPSNNQANNKYINKRIETIKRETKKLFTFRPQINKSKQPQSQLTFLQRQEQFTSLVKRKTHNLSNFIYSNEEDPLFRPKLISKQRRENSTLHLFIDNIQNMPQSHPNPQAQAQYNKQQNVFNKNFDYAQKYKMNKEIYSNRYYNDITKPFDSIPLPESKKIVSQLYIDSFKRIFSKMDTDNDNMITSLSYSIRQLPSEIIKIILPIINEMKSNNHQLSLNEFQFIMGYLCSNNELSIEDKKTILDYNKRPSKKLVSGDHSFSQGQLIEGNGNTTVNVNAKSRKLAVKHQKKMLRSLSAKNILSERPSRQITKEKYFINQSTANTERKMSIENAEPDKVIDKEKDNDNVKEPGNTTPNANPIEKDKEKEKEIVKSPLKAIKPCINLDQFLNKKTERDNDKKNEDIVLDQPIKKPAFEIPKLILKTEDEQKKTPAIEETSNKPPLFPSLFTPNPPQTNINQIDNPKNPFESIVKLTSPPTEVINTEKDQIKPIATPIVPIPVEEPQANSDANATPKPITTPITAIVTTNSQIIENLSNVNKANEIIPPPIPMNTNIPNTNIPLLDPLSQAQQPPLQTEPNSIPNLTPNPNPISITQITPSPVPPIQPRKMISFNDAKKEIEDFSFQLEKIEKELEDKYAVTFPDFNYEERLPDDIKIKLVENFFDSAEIKELFTKAASQSK